MSIAAILLAIGIPSFKYVTNANRMSGEINGLLADLQFARAEAVKEGQTVSVCASSNHTTCSAADIWNTGWLVFAGTGQPTVTNPPLRVSDGFAGTDTLQPADATTSAVQFSREGFAMGLNGTVIFELHDQTNNSVWTRCLEVTVVGALSTVTAGQQGCT